MTTATVEGLAFRKSLSVDFLCALGLEDYDNGVRIPYWSSNGKARARLRKYNEVGTTIWLPPSSAPQTIYVNPDNAKIARETKTLTIVEGESDALTLWAHGIGASASPAQRWRSSSRRRSAASTGSAGRSAQAALWSHG